MSDEPPPRLARTAPGRRHVEKQKSDDSPVRVAAGLYIGSWEAALCLPSIPPIPPAPPSTSTTLGLDGPLSIVFSLISTPPPTLSPAYHHYVHLIDDMEQSDIIAVFALAATQLARDHTDLPSPHQPSSPPSPVAALAGPDPRSASIFVHCMSGVSRSATLCAAIMLAREQAALPPGAILDDDSVARVIMQMRRYRSCIDPNEGFVRQLDLWRRMGCRLDGSTPAHAEYRLTRLALRRKESVTAGLSELAAYGQRAGAADPGAPGAAADVGREAGVFRCRKCARPLFLRTNVVEHRAPGALQASSTDADSRASIAPVMSVRAQVDPRSLKKKKKSRSVDSVSRRKKKEQQQLPQPQQQQHRASPATGVCTSMFIEPMQWMSELEGREEGKLNCPRCFARLGAWSRTGSLCSCGTCATPSFRVVKTSVDA